MACDQMRMQGLKQNEANSRHLVSETNEEMPLRRVIDLASKYASLNCGKTPMGVSRIY